MAAEHGDASRRGFWASWPQAGVAAGSLLSAGVLAVMANLQSEAEFLEWGWRVPFLLSALLVGVGWYIRNRVSESPMFEAELVEAEIPPKLPALEVIRERPKAILLGSGLRVGENISYYILTVFSLTYLVDVAAESRSTALNALLIAAAVQFFAIPLLAMLSDRIGRHQPFAERVVDRKQEDAREHQTDASQRGASFRRSRGNHDVMFSPQSIGRSYARAAAIATYTP